MLTDNTVLEYIKINLGYPFTEIEILDKDIIYRLKEYLLKRYFSIYVPIYKYFLVNRNNIELQTNIPNRFKIIDPDNAGILTVFDIISDNEIIKSLGIMGSQGVAYSDLPNWYSMMYSKGTQMLTTNWYQTFEFIHPYYIEVRPRATLPLQFLVCYEAQHICFETIPAYREPLFLDLALAFIKMNIAEIRSKYQSIETQFGEIRLNWDTIKADGKELWENTITKLEKIAPKVIVDIG